MNMSRQSMMGLLALLLLSALSIWLLAGLNPDADDLRGSRGPVWYFNQAELVATGRDGRVLYRVTSPRIIHDPSDGSANLESPVVNWEQGQSPPLRVAATRGRVSLDAADLWLGEGVRISDSNAGGPIEFRTEWLALDTRTQLATTDADIVVVSTHGELTGRGLVADMNRGTIRIESEVRAHYVR